VKAGIARLRDEETLDSPQLHRIHWKERVQSGRQISKLPNDFYPKLRRCLEDARRRALRKPEGSLEYKKVKQLSLDIVNSRLKKIVASSNWARFKPTYS
jgi:hypothetical protein